MRTLLCGSQTLAMNVSLQRKESWVVSEHWGLGCSGKAGLGNQPGLEYAPWMLAKAKLIAYKKHMKYIK